MFSATYDPDLHAEPQTPDMKIYLGIEFHAIENEVAHHPDYYSIEDTYLPHLSKFYSPHINWISNQLPPSPPLTQLRDIPAVSLLDKTAICRSPRSKRSEGKSAQNADRSWFNFLSIDLSPLSSARLRCCIEPPQTKAKM